MKTQFQKIEILSMTFGLLLFLSSFYLYIMDVPIAQLLFGFRDEGSEKVVGKMDSSRGPVRRKKISQPEFRNIPAQEKLFNYDTIVTGPDSTAKLQFEDGSEIELGPKTMIQLEFESKLTFSGIDRATHINIVSGRVKGTIKTKKIVLKSRKKKIEITNKAKPKIIEINELTISEAKEAAETEEEASAQFEPEEIVEVKNIETEGVKEVTKTETLENKEPESTVEKTSPPIEEKIPKNKETPKINQKPLKLKIIGAKNNHGIQFKTAFGKANQQVNLSWKSNIANLEYETILKKNGKIIDSKKLTSKKLRTNLKYNIDKPGSYELEIKSKETANSTGIKLSIPFKLKKHITAINLQEPLIAGKETASNTYTGDVLEDFDLTLRWTPIKRAGEYKIRFYKNKNDLKPFLTKTSKKPNLTMNKKKIFKGKVFYQVITKHPSGFIISSRKKPFRFDFFPPVLKFPKNKISLSQAEIEVDKGEILFTWQKTNFTDYYQIEISNNPKFKKSLKKLKTKENFSAIALSKKGKYWWRVRGFGQGVYSPHTPIFHFQIK